jgi:hypothetical protein
MFYRWRRMEEEDRGRVWLLYGWFTALMACGSCVGAVAWAARMMNLVNFFEANTSPTIVQKMSFVALHYSWISAFLVTYAVEFLCLSASKLLVLDRMSMFAAPQDDFLQTRWALAGRVVMAAVVLGNAVGLAANAAAAVQFHKASQAISTASAAYAANNSYTKDVDLFRLLSQEEVQRGSSIASVQSFCEAAVLLFIVVAFAVVGVLSARRVNARLVGVDAASYAAATGRAIRRRMVGTTVFVFVAFVLRAAFSTMFAVANSVANQYTLTESCPKQCDECHNDYFLMSQWLAYAPEFQLLIVLISSPVALLVALWGMTSEATLHLMKSSQRQALVELTRVKSVLQK